MSITSGDVKGDLLRKHLSSHDAYTSVFENHPDMVYVVDSAGCFQHCNDATVNLLGYSRHEWVHRRIGDFTPGDDHQRVMESFKKALTGESQQLEVLSYHRNGRARHIALTLVPAVVEGQVVGVYGFGKDISQRVHTEERLRQSQTRLAEAQKIAQIGNWDWDLDTDEIEASIEALRIYGFPPNTHTLTGRLLFGFMHPDDRGTVMNALQTALESPGEVYDVEYRVTLPNEDTKHLHVYGTATMAGGHPKLVGTVQDLSERKKTDEMLRKSDKLSIVGQLAAGVAHEIRNPLTTIMGFLQLLMGMELDRPKRLEYYNIMQDALNDIAFIAGEMLVLAKPQASHVLRHNVLSVLKEVVSLLKAEAQLNGVNIDVTGISKNVMILCDANQIKQVLINIIKNAIEAMTVGGLLQISVTEVGDDVHIEFLDNGCGIDRDRIPNLFEPFYTTKERGTGLGLMVSNKIVQDHNGSICIDSSEGIGTSVTVILPRVSNHSGRHGSENPKCLLP